MARKRSRKPPKPKIAQTPPITYRRLYVKKPGARENTLTIVGGGLVLLGVIMPFQNFNSSDDALAAKFFFGGFILLGSFLVLASIFGQLESVILDEENLIFSYRLTKKVYKASDVAAVSWQTGFYRLSSGPTIFLGYQARFKGDLGPTGDGQYGQYTYLLVQMKNGGGEQIPGSPYSHFDIQKPLQAWLNKYDPPEGENIDHAE